MFTPLAAAEPVLLALGLVLSVGAVATWRVLSAKAAPYTRADDRGVSDSHDKRIFTLACHNSFILKGET